MNFDRKHTKNYSIYDISTPKLQHILRVNIWFAIYIFFLNKFQTNMPSFISTLKWTYIKLFINVIFAGFFFYVRGAQKYCDNITSYDKQNVELMKLILRLFWGRWNFYWKIRLPRLSIFICFPPKIRSRKRSWRLPSN